MNSLFNAADFSSILKRVERLSPTSQRQWGKMDVAQMLAHCNVSLETAMGKHIIKPVFIGKIIGPLMKSRVLSDKPFGRNSPTDKSYIFNDERKFEDEKQKTIASLKNFMQEAKQVVPKHLMHFLESLHPRSGAYLNGNTCIII